MAGDNAGDIVAAGILGLLVGAVAEDALGRPSRESRLQQAYDQGWNDGCQAQANADRVELQRLQWIIVQRSEVVQAREAEVVRLNGIVANQAKALAELVVSAELPAPKHPPTNGHSPH